MNPCLTCKCKPNCPLVCLPKRDWEKHERRKLRKRKPKKV